MERSSATSGSKKATPLTVFFYIIPLTFLYANNAWAFKCSSPVGENLPGSSGQSIEVTLSSDTEGKINSIFDLSQIQCEGHAGSNTYIDYVNTAQMTSFFNENIFPGVKSGLIINGKKYQTPIPADIKLLELYSYKLTADKKSLDVKAFIETSEKPTKYARIAAGETLAELELVQKNNKSGDTILGHYKWKLVAKNDYNYITNTCTINNGQQMNVDFKEIERFQLKESAYGSQPSVNQQLNTHCNDPVTQDITIRLVSDNPSFTSDLIKTSNPDIGIAMLHKGQLIKPDTEFVSHLSQGNGSDSVDFKVVKKNIPSTDIATGAFTGSATLIVSVI